MDWVNNLCNCFNPEIRSKILNYLNSEQLNGQVIEQEKCSESQADNESIYDKIKAKSYYYIKHEDIHSQDLSSFKGNQIQFHNDQAIDDHDSGYYPLNKSYNQIYKYKLRVLKTILNEQVLANQHYLKVYDSQDENKILVYALNKAYLQKQKQKKQNVYRFQFVIPVSSSCNATVKDFLNLTTQTQLNQSLTESLLKSKEIIKKQDQINIFYRTYNKILVISQHDFVTAQKTELVEELNEKNSNEGKQVYDQHGYNLVFSVKGIKQEKSIQYNRGWINLCGLRAKFVKLQSKQIKNQSKDAQDIEIEGQLLFQGFINVQLDTTVNSNMLRQPMAKQIRAYIQKLICLLQKSDAI